MSENNNSQFPNNSNPSNPLSKVAVGIYLVMLLIITVNTVISTSHIAKSTPKYTKLMDDIGIVLKKVDGTIPENIPEPKDIILGISDSSYAKEIKKHYNTSKNNVESLDSFFLKETINPEILLKIEKNIDNITKLASKQRAKFAKDDILVLGPHKDDSYTLISIKTPVVLVKK